MKNVSLISLITVVLFTAITFSTSDVEANFSDTDIFGWPFAFFTAAPENLINAKDSFSIINLLADILFCIIIAYGIRKVINALKVERKKNRTVTQIVHTKRQRFSVRQTL
jgi:hypothetical protein